MLFRSKLFTVIFGLFMGLEKVIEFLDSEKFQEIAGNGNARYIKKYHAGMQIHIAIQGSEMAIMPIIDIRQLPPPEAMPIPSLLKWEIYWPENSFAPLRHAWNGNATDMIYMRKTYVNILELFRKIFIFYGITKS